ncbi:MAG: tetratricopeptide repeat protein [Cytophagales bacterium]
MDKKRKSVDLPEAVRLVEAEANFTEGEKYFLLEDYSKALLYFLKASELNPRSAATFFKLAEVLAKGKGEDDLKNAAINIEQAIKLDKKNPFYYLSAVGIYNGQGEFSKSAATLEALLKEVPGMEQQLYELAAIYMFDKRDAEALRTYERAESIFGVNETSSLQKQRIFLEQGKTDDAIGEGERLIKAFPDEERYVLALADLMAQNNQRTGAITALEKYLTENPESVEAKMQLVGFYRDNGDEGKSKQLVHKIFDDKNAQATSKIAMLGALQSDLAQRKQAKQQVDGLEKLVVELFNQLSAEYPDDGNVHLVGGDIYLTLEQPVKAKGEFSKAVQRGVSSFDAWQNLLYLETEMNQLDSVIVHADAALEYFPNQAMVYYFKGFAHLRKREFNYAVNSLEQAKKLSNANPGLLIELNTWLGDAYQALKLYEKSSNAYDEVLLANPENDIVLNNYSYYLALRGVDLEKAEKMSSQLVKAHPTNASYLDTHAWVLYARGKYKEAKKYIEKAIQAGDTSATLFEHYGDILFKLGEVDEAVTQWGKAKFLDRQNEVLQKKIANRKIF